MGLLTPNEIKGFQSLYALQIRYLLSTENQIVKGLEKMIDAAYDSQLKQAFQSHLVETEEQVQRLERILTDMTGDVDDKKCSITAALIASGEGIVKESDEGAVRDAGLIASAQKIEHFEIASYGSARDWARLLGRATDVSLLQKTLDEEKHADSALNGISERANRAAVAA